MADSSRRIVGTVPSPCPQYPGFNPTNGVLQLPGPVAEIFDDAIAQGKMIRLEDGRLFKIVVLPSGALACDPWDN